MGPILKESRRSLCFPEHTLRHLIDDDPLGDYFNTSRLDGAEPCCSAIMAQLCHMASEAHNLFSLGLSSLFFVVIVADQDPIPAVRPVGVRCVAVGVVGRCDVDEGDDGAVDLDPVPNERFELLLKRFCCRASRRAQLDLVPGLHRPVLVFIRLKASKFVMPLHTIQNCLDVFVREMWFGHLGCVEKYTDLRHIIQVPTVIPLAPSSILRRTSALSPSGTWTRVRSILPTVHISWDELLDIMNCCSCF